MINEDSFFFIRVDTICHRPAITCSPETSLVEMAQIMKRDNISGIVVVNGPEPVGILSLRDLRDLIADDPSRIASLTVGDVMKTSLITIRTSDLLFKAIFTMARNNIHRLIVLDENHHLAGVLTDTDLLKVQTKSPLYLVQEIEASTSMEQLRRTADKVTGMIQFAAKISDDPKSLIQLISHFNDAITKRLIELLESEQGVRLPAGAAYLALGSEGREEQTLRTDQDSAIVYADTISANDLRETHRFAELICAGLEKLGVPLCPGNMMASNPQWCHSLSEWADLIESWLTTPGPDQTVFFGVFQDLRVLHGDSGFEEKLRSLIIQSAHRNTHFFPNMARNIIRFKPPLGMFGRLLTERSGEGKGKLDLKKGGLFALTRGISLIAMEEGISGGTTWSKLERLGDHAHIAPNDMQVLEESLTFLAKLRLDKQLLALRSGQQPGNFVDPLVLKEQERVQLRAAFRGVNTLFQILTSRYQLNLVSR